MSGPSGRRKRAIEELATAPQECCDASNEMAQKRTSACPSTTDDETFGSFTTTVRASRESVNHGGQVWTVRHSCAILTLARCVEVAER